MLIFPSILPPTGARGLRHLLHRRDHRPTKPRRLQPERVNGRWRSHGIEHRRELDDGLRSRRWLGEQERCDAESQARRSGSAGTTDLLWSGPRPSMGRKASGRQIKTHITWHGMLYFRDRPGQSDVGVASRCRSLILVEGTEKKLVHRPQDTSDHAISLDLPFDALESLRADPPIATVARTTALDNDHIGCTSWRYMLSDGVMCAELLNDVQPKASPMRPWQRSNRACLTTKLRLRIKLQLRVRSQSSQ